MINVKNKTDFSRFKISEIDTITADFKKKFPISNEKIFCCKAPARVNLIGDHIDYNGGFVFPCAINLYLTLAIRKNTRKTFSYYASNLNQSFEFNFNEIENVKNFSYNKDNGFANYLNGALKFLAELNVKINSGFDVIVYSDIPIGSGLSSSAALEVAFILAICTIFNFQISRKQIALLGKKIENEFLGLQSGIMDQFIISCAKSNTAMLLNTDTLDYKLIPFELEPYALVVMNSCKMRTLVSSKYNERKAECELILSILQNHQKFKKIKNLCELSERDLPIAKIILQSSKNLLENNFTEYSSESYIELLFRRLKHCVMENIFVQEAAKALEKQDYKELGKLFTLSHNSLKHDYEVSGKELDTLVQFANEQKSCLGARMTGAGFSGCAIAIVKKSNLTEFFLEVQKGYKKKCNLNCDFYVCNAEQGAKIYEF